MGFGIIEKYVRHKMGTARPATESQAARLPAEESKPGTRGPIWIKDSIAGIQRIQTRPAMKAAAKRLAVLSQTVSQFRNRSLSLQAAHARTLLNAKQSAATGPHGPNAKLTDYPMAYEVPPGSHNARRPLVLSRWHFTRNSAAPVEGGQQSMGFAAKSVTVSRTGSRNAACRGMKHNRRTSIMPVTNDRTVESMADVSGSQEYSTYAPKHIFEMNNLFNRPSTGTIVC